MITFPVRLRRPLLVVAIFCCVVLRIYLTADRDILALNQGADDLWQIRTASVVRR